MAVTLDQARQAKQAFIKQYWGVPYGSYFTSVGISLVSIQAPSLPITEHGDHCIAVGLHTPLPSALALPSHHVGVRVVTYEAGIPSAY